MSEELQALLKAVAQRMADEFKAATIEANGTRQEDLVAEWEEYGYEDLDDVSAELDRLVKADLS